MRLGECGSGSCNKEGEHVISEAIRKVGALACNKEGEHGSFWKLSSRKLFGRSVLRLFFWQLQGRRAKKVSSCKESERSADEVRHWVGVAHGMQHRRQEVVGRWGLLFLRHWTRTKRSATSRTR